MFLQCNKIKTEIMYHLFFWSNFKKFHFLASANFLLFQFRLRFIFTIYKSLYETGKLGQLASATNRDMLPFSTIK